MTQLRELDAGLFRDSVTFIAGPGRVSGKTSLLKAALLLLRREGVKAAVLGLGFDGDEKGETGARVESAAETRNRGSRGSRIEVAAGEIFVSAERWLRGSPTHPEILASLPESGALGKLAIARAARSGEVILVGPGRNEVVAEAISLCREAFGARSVLVDGAASRLTQVAALPGAGHIQALRVDAANLAVMARRMRLLATLSALPLLEEVGKEDLARGSGMAVSGPLTGAVLTSLPSSVRTLVIEDMTKVFLDEDQLAILLRGRRLLVRRTPVLLGFVLILRGIREDVLLEELGPEFPPGLLFGNPYELEFPLEAA
jgi:hypothetical protein